MKQQLYLCSCYSAEHQMIWNPSPLKNEKEIYIHIHLVKKSFWYRLKYGIKYILGYQSKYGAFDEIILNEEHSKQLKKAITYLNSKNK